nr:hypothetical protein [Tanacetum cinerariifolium]
MTSFDYRLNHLYPIKECSSCGALYTTDYCYSIGILEDKIICDLDKTPDLSQRSPHNCPKCGHPVDGQYCQGCALLRKKFEEYLFTSGIEHGILQDSFKPSNDNPNVDNAPREPFVVNQDPVKTLISGMIFIIFNNKIFIVKIAGLLMKLTNEEEKLIEEEQAANAQYWKILACYDDDDGDYAFAISPNEPSFFDEDFPKEIYLNPLFDEEIIPMKIDPYHFNAESDLIESMLNHNSLIISSSKIDSLFDEFAGELTLLKSIPPGIDETDCVPEEETHFIKRFFNDSPLLPENESFHFDIPSFIRPPAKPPNGNTEILNVKMMGDIFEQMFPMPRFMITLVPNQEKSPDLLSHHGLVTLWPSAECPMMIHRKNTPILDVPLFHFYPL